MSNEAPYERVTTPAASVGSIPRPTSGCAMPTKQRGESSNSGDVTPPAGNGESPWTTWLRGHAHEMDSGALMEVLLRLGKYVQ